MTSEGAAGRQRDARFEKILIECEKVRARATIGHYHTELHEVEAPPEDI